MRNERKKQLSYIYDSLDGESWQITDSPDEVTSLYNIVSEGEIRVKNRILEMDWKIHSPAKGSCYYPFSRCFGESKMFLKTRKEKKKKRLVITRTNGCELLEMEVELSEKYWHHIKSLTSKVEQILPEAQKLENKECPCPGCAKNQERISEEPSSHPVYYILQDIINSRDAYYVSLDGSQQGVVAKFTPCLTSADQGVCRILSPSINLSVDLKQLFFIRVELREVKGVPHVVLQGSCHERTPCFVIYSKDTTKYERWSKLLKNQYDLV